MSSRSNTYLYQPLESPVSPVSPICLRANRRICACLQAATIIDASARDGDFRGPSSGTLVSVLRASNTMSFSSDSRALSVPYVLNRLVRTLADNVKYNAPPPSSSSSSRQDDNGSPDTDGMSGNGDPSKSSAWANKFKVWGKKTDGCRFSFLYKR